MKPRYHLPHLRDVPRLRRIEEEPHAAQLHDFRRLPTLKFMMKRFENVEETAPAALEGANVPIDWDASKQALYQHRR